MQICFKKWLNYLTLCLVISYLLGQKTAPILESLNMFAAMKGHEHGDPYDSHMGDRQCDQIGRFLKVLGNKLSLLSCPNICQLFGPLFSRSLLSKNYFGYSRAALEKLGYF